MSESAPNFLDIQEPVLCNYSTSKCTIQQLPYEHSSSFKKGSKYGPAAIMYNSKYVEYFDLELKQETYRKCGIACTPPLDFSKVKDKEAMNLIFNETSKLLNDNKFVVSLGAEHTVTYGLFKAFQRKYNDIGILQLDAHSDLRKEYEGNPWSHASVMYQINKLNPSIFQVGIRAQCVEEHQLINSSTNIHTWYAHKLKDNDEWMDDIINKLPRNLYITIDTDVFDPSICPSVGTPEPGGLKWYSTLKFLRKVFSHSNVKGFDIVELKPTGNEDTTAYNMAQLCYKLIGYKYYRYL